MTDKISIEEFETRALNLLERLVVVRKLHSEANLLLESIDYESLDEDQQENVDQIAYEIAGAGLYIYEGPSEGFWLPSLC